MILAFQLNNNNEINSSFADRFASHVLSVISELETESRKFSNRYWKTDRFLLPKISRLKRKLLEDVLRVVIKFCKWFRNFVQINAGKTYYAYNKRTVSPFKWYQPLYKNMLLVQLQRNILQVNRCQRRRVVCSVYERN